ncbi:hypothetical protein BP6252_05908 [Coleophoma cylindrospora]|uniref:Enoyl reductase (ER) domain-containing protein n=1 Tax=Coleophoma cylindrospora TaxID=1849047 RepID=A0A3D8RLF8_9HELO|nr:hypothetical protein BP6252_05908 [Coleophoma cylindrospora]
MALPETQSAIVQSDKPTAVTSLAVAHSVPLPHLPLASPNHVLVRVLAVALNPNDHKMATYFHMAGSTAGCDFCGVVVQSGPNPTHCSTVHPPGTRICGAVFPYSLQPDDKHNGAFAQWVVADARLLLRVPDAWTDLQGAALGGVAWGTLALAFSDPQALALQGLPSKPAASGKGGAAVPVLVYGGATSTGTMACQLLRLSGYAPIAVASTTSAPLAIMYGAAATAPYTSPTCAEDIRSLAAAPIQHALDCITDGESAAICFGALSRAGGRYACLEQFHTAWQTRRAVKVKVVMGPEILGARIELGDTVYTREPSPENFEIGVVWAREMQSILDAGLVKTHPIREVPGRWEGIIHGMNMLQKGEVKGEKLVVRISDL